MFWHVSDLVSVCAKPVCSERLFWTTKLDVLRFSDVSCINAADILLACKKNLIPIVFVVRHN